MARFENIPLTFISASGQLNNVLTGANNGFIADIDDNQKNVFVGILKIDNSHFLNMSSHCAILSLNFSATLGLSSTNGISLFGTYGYGSFNFRVVNDNDSEMSSFINPVTTQTYQTASWVQGQRSTWNFTHSFTGDGIGEGTAGILHDGLGIAIYLNEGNDNNAEGTNFYLTDPSLTISYTTSAVIQYVDVETDHIFASYNIEGGEQPPDYPIGTQNYKPNYHISKWKDRATGIEYNPSDLPLVVDYDVIYEAVWEPNEYTIQYNANGGIGQINSKTLKYTDSYILPNANIGFLGPEQTIIFNENKVENNSLLIPYSYHQLFSGRWIWENNGTIQYFNEGEDINQKFSVSNKETITLYAEWDNLIELNNIPEVTRQYHSFKGWLNPLTNTIYSSEELNQLQVNYQFFNTLIAQWKKCQFRIFLYNSKENSLKRLPHSFLKNQKIKKIFIYIPSIGIKEI